MIMDVVEIDEDGYVICPHCSHRFHFGEGERETEYTGGGYADSWYVFFCPKCDQEFRSTSESGYM